MKRIVLLLSFLFFVLVFPRVASAQTRAKTVHVRTYTTKKGKTVKAHYRSKPSKHKTAYLGTMYYKREEAA